MPKKKAKTSKTVTSGGNISNLLVSKKDKDKTVKFELITIEDAEKSNTATVQALSLEYLQNIDKLITKMNTNMVKVLVRNTVVYNREGEKVGKIQCCRWIVSASNSYNMPIGYTLNYEVLTKEKSILNYHHKAVFTKDEIIKYFETKISTIKNGKRNDRKPK